MQKLAAPENIQCVLNTQMYLNQLTSFTNQIPSQEDFQED